MLRKNDDGGLPVPFEPGEGLADQPITRARAIKLAGAAAAAGAFAIFWGADDADALTAAQRRRRRRRRRRRLRARRRRQNNVTSEQSTVNFGSTTVGSPVTRPVSVTNEGDTPVTLTPTVVGDGFTLLDTGNITLAPGETKVVDVRLDALERGAQDATLRLVDARDGLLLEAVDLVGNVNVL